MNKLKSILCLILILGISYTLEAQTQEIPSDQDIKVKVKESEEVLVLIDGVKYDTKILDLLDTDRIESIDILKGKKAMEKYKVKNAIVVTTKKSVKESVSISIKGENKIVVKESDKNVIKGNPAVVIDGEVSEYHEALSMLTPSQSIYESQSELRRIVQGRTEQSGRLD